MNINDKIREARIKAGLTQEQAADRLAVSRQTMSHWENGKTYPDIASVVRMSDLYGVSLDYLLKDVPEGGAADERYGPAAGEETDEIAAQSAKERGMNDYISYLEESTNIVKKKAAVSRILVLGIYLLIWALAIISFWAGLQQDALGYGLVILFTGLPAATFVVCAITGGANYFGRAKWFLCPAFGVLHLLSNYLTYTLSNMIHFGRFLFPVDYTLLFLGIIVSAAGMLAGKFIRLLISYVRP